MRPKILDGPPLPNGALTILKAYSALRAAAGREGMSGAPVPIRFSDIAAWQSTMRTSLHPDEVEAIRLLDEERARFEAERRAKTDESDDED